MARSRSNFLYLLALFAAALAFGAAHRAQACPQGMSAAKHLPCCDGMDPPGMQHSLNARFDCATTRDHLQDCASAGHCVCGQPLRVVQVTAREVRLAGPAPSAVLVWPALPITAGGIPRPRGPPDTGSAGPPGRHTYLAT